MKGQGLPINTIVLAILALLVLVILAAIFVPGFRSLITSIIAPAPTSVQQFTDLCSTQYCGALDGKYGPDTLVNIKYSDWCTREIQVYSTGDCPTGDRCWTQGDTGTTDCQPHEDTPTNYGGRFATDTPEQVKLTCSFKLTTGQTCNPTDWRACCYNGTMTACNCA